jgi:transposase
MCASPSAPAGADRGRGGRPAVWVADRYGGQLGHGAVRQMCLAHLLRDAKYAIEAGDTGFAPGF